MGTTPLTLTPDDSKTLIQGFQELRTQYTAVADQITKQGTVNGDTKAAIARVDTVIADLQAKYTDGVTARLDSIEQQCKQYVASLPTPGKSIGHQVIEDAGLIAASKQRGGRINVTVTATKAAVLTSTGLAAPDRLDGIVSGPVLPYGVRQLVPQGRTTSGSVQYLRETAAVNNAAPVAENTKKPLSELDFLPVNAPVEVIATYFKATRQCLDDLPSLAAQINARGVYMVKIKEDNQLLNGTGVTPQLQGFMPLAGAAPAPAGAGATLVDAIGTAVFDLAGKGFMPDGTVVPPAAWGGVALLKNSQGNYLFANPVDYSPNGRIWGTTLVMSANMPADKFLVGAFQGNSLLLDRDEISVQVATQNEDDFIFNRVTILIEERLVNLVFTAAAFEKGDVPE